jgi:transcriptional regulator with XRE-family HTH domain
MSSISPDYFGMSLQNNNEVKTLKQLLKEKDINKTALAKRMGVGRQTILQWENGERAPVFKNAVLLAAELGISLKTLALSLGYDVSLVPSDPPELRNYQESGPSIEHQQPDESQGAVSA